MCGLELLRIFHGGRGRPPTEPSSPENPFGQGTTAHCSANTGEEGDEQSESRGFLETPLKEAISSSNSGAGSPPRG